MSSLMDLRKKINSIKATRKITSAMKMVSSAKLKKINNIIENLDHYIDSLDGIMESVMSSQIEENDIPHFFKKTVINNHLIVLITGDKGLCGSFNANIIKSTNAYINENKKINNKIYCIGKKGFDHFKNKKNLELLGNCDVGGHDFHLIASRATTDIFDMLRNDSIDSISIIGSDMSMHQLLPIILSDKSGTVSNFEPNIGEFFDKFIEQWFFGQLLYEIVNTVSKEHFARMTAMNSATTNADNMLKKMELLYNTTRQSKVTNEIIEIVSGAKK